MPINTLVQLYAAVTAGEPSLEIAETLLLIPDLFHFWLSGVATSEYTNATTTQCLDPRAQAWATELLGATWVACTAPSGARPPGHDSRAPPPGGGRADTPAPRGRGRPCNPRHGLGGRCGAIPAAGVGVHQRRHLVACRLGARLPAHHRRVVRGESDKRGRDRRHRAAAEERQRDVARPRVSAGVGRRGRRLRFRRARRTCRSRSGARLADRPGRAEPDASRVNA